ACADPATRAMHRALALGRGFLWTRRSSKTSSSSGGLSCCSWPLPSLFRPAAREEETGAPGGAHPARRDSLRVRPKLWCQGLGRGGGGGGKIPPARRPSARPGGATPAPPAALPRQRAERPRRPRRTARRKRKYKRHDARDRALAALRATPDATPTEIAKLAKVSRSTAVHARHEIEKEARKEARKSRATSTLAKPDRRQRAQNFLREQLARGAKPASDVEEAAAKAHVDPVALTQARSDLGIVTSRANTGGAQAVQWSLFG